MRLTLTHRKIPDRDFALGVSGGWHSHLEMLQHRAKGKTPPAFWDIWRETASIEALRLSAKWPVNVDDLNAVGLVRAGAYARTPSRP